MIASADHRSQDHVPGLFIRHSPLPGSFPDHLAITRDRTGKNLDKRPNSEWVLSSEGDLDDGYAIIGAGVLPTEIKEAITRDGVYYSKRIKLTVLDQSA